MSFLSEAELEEILLQLFERLGYRRGTDAEIGPDGFSPERESYGHVILEKRLIAAIERLNPHIPFEARWDAIKGLVKTGDSFPRRREPSSSPFDSGRGGH